jgi:hypothetical protein
VGASCWSIGEVCSGITCACLPTLRPCITRCLPGLRTQRGDSDERDLHGSQKKKYYYRHPSSAGGPGGGSGGGGSGIGDRPRGLGDADASTRGILMGLDDLELQAASNERLDDRSGNGMRATVNHVENHGAGYHGQWPWERAGGSGLSGLSRLGLEPSVQTEIGAGVSRPNEAWPLADKGIKVKRDIILSPG